MEYRFGPFVLDASRRELRQGDDVEDVQPLVFELLLYLVQHRDRVVTKAELLDSVWSDTAVSEASLARAVSLARRALGDSERDAPLIRTHPRVGYRFVANVEEDVRSRQSASADAGQRTPLAPARSAFARAGETHIAYQVIGDGPVDVVIVNGWVLSTPSLFDDPQLGAFLSRLAERARLIVFDKRGTGHSDRVKELPGLAQRMEDLTAVLDAAGARQAHVLGVSEGAPMSLLYAASHPERVSGLALVGGFARMMRDQDQDFGWTDRDVDRLEAYISSSWGQGRTLSTSMASRDGDEAVQAWAGRAELVGGSPGAALELWNMNRAIDVRDVLSVIDVPCVVLHSSEDPVIDIAHGRQLAECIDGARFVEIEGVDHLPFFEASVEQTHATLSAWIEQPGREPASHRRLATLLLLDPGPSPSVELVNAIEQACVVNRGRRADAEGIPLARVFEGPAAAARCALAVSAAGHRHATGVRGALVCSEIDCVEQEPEASSGVALPTLGVSGPGVDAAAALLAEVPEAEAWTTAGVVELAVGSGISFEPRARQGNGEVFAIAEG